MDVLYFNTQISGYVTPDVCNPHFRGYITLQQVAPCMPYKNEMNYVTRNSNLLILHLNLS
jgi:hypothetical protein